MGGTISIFKNGIDQGFNIPAPPLTEKTLPDQKDKVFLITGANSGVGYEVSRILYSRNGTVYMACRNESKADEAIKNIKSAYPNSTGKLIYLHLDLSDLSTIKSSAEAFLAQSTRLDWLNNNAGISLPPKNSKTPQGHELQIGTNVLGPFLFTKLLLPILQSTASQPNTPAGQTRVSWAGSFAVDSFSPKSGVAFDSSGNIENYATEMAYGVSKAANRFLAYEFGKRHGDRDSVLHNAYNPGNLKTNLLHNLKSITFGTVTGLVLDWLVLFPAVMGAYTEIYAGLSTDLSVQGDQGGYVVPWGRKSTWNREDVAVEMRDGGASQKLWEWCERETERYA